MSSDLPSSPPGAPAPRRERNALETRKRLLDAAEAEFASKGFPGARLRDVAQAAGVQQALIHHYFDDKDGLYRAVLERALEQTTANSWAILGKATDVVSLLEAFVDLLLKFHEDHANFLAILRLEAASGSSLFVDLIQARTGPVFEAAESTLRGYQALGKVRSDLAPARIIESIIALTLFPLQEATLLGALWPGHLRAHPSPDDHRRSVVSIALRGLLP